MGCLLIYFFCGFPQSPASFDKPPLGSTQKIYCCMIFDAFKMYKPGHGEETDMDKRWELVFVLLIWSVVYCDCWAGLQWNTTIRAAARKVLLSNTYISQMHHLQTFNIQLTKKTHITHHSTHYLLLCSDI